jgi:hypothetical protein
MKSVSERRNSAIGQISANGANTSAASPSERANARAARGVERHRGHERRREHQRHEQSLRHQCDTDAGAEQRRSPGAGRPHRQPVRLAPARDVLHHQFEQSAKAHRGAGE